MRRARGLGRQGGKEVADVLDKQANNIVHWSDFEAGGHFAALETPSLLVQDIRGFFASLPA